MHARATAAVVALASLLGGCGVSDGKAPPARYSLEGSLLQLMDLGYDEARLQLAPDDLSVLFVRIKPLDSIAPDGGTGTAGNSEDYPFKIGVALKGQPLFGNVRVDLAELDMNGTQRATFSRDVINDPRKLFPKATRATLFLNKVPKVNETVSGDFNVTFEEGVQAASGRTVFSKGFSAKVVQ
jgi:hypothetical protein